LFILKNGGVIKRLFNSYALGRAYKKEVIIKEVFPLLPCLLRNKDRTVNGGYWLERRLLGGVT